MIASCQVAANRPTSCVQVATLMVAAENSYALLGQAMREERGGCLDSQAKTTSFQASLKRTLYRNMSDTVFTE